MQDRTSTYIPRLIIIAYRCCLTAQFSNYRLKMNLVSASYESTLSAKLEYTTQIGQLVSYI